MTERPSGRWLVKSGAADLLIRTGSGTDNAVFEIEVGGGNAVRTLTATVLSCSEDTCVVSIEGQSTVVRLTPHDHDWYAMAGGESFTVTALAESSTDSRGADESDAGDTSPAADPDALCAPMPAAVSAILVQPGTVVDAGDALVRLEAMKMELAVRAPWSGRVATVDCRVGDLVQPGRPLVTLEPQPITPADEARRA